jgi:benzylsuccinate CoA-transferase BbsF subunit
VETARVVGPFHVGTFGPERSVLYENVNAGKLGLTLDLSQEMAREVVRDLVAWADIMIESFSPGMMKRWDLDYERLRQIKPDLIMLSSSLMGASGPYSTFAGYGNIGAAMSGFQNLVGWPDRPPFGPFGPYTDYVGPRFALVILLAAIDSRRRTGQGCNIDISQAEAGIQFLAPQIADYFAQGQIAERMGNRDTQMAPHGIYPCQPVTYNGETWVSWVAIAVRSDAEWQKLATLIGGSELAQDGRFASLPARLQQSDQLDDLVGAWTQQLSAQEVEGTLQAEGLPAHIVSTSLDALSDPQLQFRGHFIELEHPLHGKTVVEGSRYQLSRTPAIIKRTGPTFGQDRALILRDILHYDEERIAQLEAAGIFR